MGPLAAMLLKFAALWIIINGAFVVMIWPRRRNGLPVDSSDQQPETTY